MAAFFIMPNGDYFLEYSICQEVHTALSILPVIPKVIYEDIVKDKSKIIQENKQKSGVYRWTHNINGKTYVGSSVNLSNRFYYWFNSKAMVHNIKISIIARAILKYGLSSFKLEVLEYCDKSHVLEREQYYINLLKPEYNILKIAGSKLGSKHSEETKEKISLSLIGNKRSVGGKRYLTPCTVLDTQTNVIIKYNSITLAAKALGSSPKAIRAYLKRASMTSDPYPYKNRYVITKLEPGWG